MTLLGVLRSNVIGCGGKAGGVPLCLPRYDGNYWSARMSACFAAEV